MNGVSIALHQNQGILTGLWRLLHRAGASVDDECPAGFPLDQLIEVLFRIVGMNAMDARKTRQDFAASPTAYFPIPTRYDMDNRHVTLAAGSGLLLQMPTKGER